MERFEEKLGTDMRILRALALALGCTRQCQADTMFVGNQRNDFIQKLRRTAGTDVYLQGALYLLETDAPQRRARLDELAAREYSKEELEADRKAAAEQEEQEKELQRQREVRERQEKLKQRYDGSAESLLQFMRGYYYGAAKKAALDMVYEKLLEWPAGCAQTLAAEEMQKFFELCGDLVEYEPRPRKEILTMVQTIVGGEAA